MKMRKAGTDDYPAVMRMFEALWDEQEAHGGFTVWKRGVYPTEEVIRNDIKEGTLYVFEEEGLCAAVTLDHKQAPEYAEQPWTVSAADDRVLVMHRLIVPPENGRKGTGYRAVQCCIEEAERSDCASIRLDTGSQNIPAVRLYEKCGFRIISRNHIELGGKIPNAQLFLEYTVGNHNDQSITPEAL